MEISFKIQGDVQLVEIDGLLSDPEAAAIRVKVEQKINQGRKKILFGLGNFPIENDAARNLLQGIISYTLNRGTLTAVCGIKANHRPFLLLPGAQQIKVFLTQAEGIDYLQKVGPADPKSSLEVKRKSEAEIKEDALKNLLEKYEVFQHNDDDDPFRLQFLIEQYNTHPNKEALVVEKRATDSLMAAREEIRLLEDDCEVLAKQVKALMLYRKTPLSGRELKLKQESLDKEVDETHQIIEKLQVSILEAKKLANEAKLTLEKTLRASLEALQELENNIKSTLESQIREASDLLKLDTEEQAKFDEIMNRPK